MRVLADTNVLVSFLLGAGEGGAIRAIFRAFLDGRFTLLMPEQLLDELVNTVSGKPRLVKRISPSELAHFVALLQQVAEPVAVLHEPIPAVTRDPDDDYVLAYALVGSADYLVTGDKDLLALRGHVRGLEIVTPAQLVGLLGPG